ncbi:MAG: tRNA (N(6)-L-threonylcarbamoyladenosine(37)-C(2))-methylthiotransferase MtaB, partial [Lachnospiraceae bacterium]|nr:tRNA (N(6)-L-threonylcarbamoyladenosine(37)-C(2))-methylthiotransferase MtaB [Lachnospiraceae bacterium]
EKADVYIVNTCTVTNIADRKSRKMLHRAKRNNPEAFVVAAGCYVDSSKKTQGAEKSIDLFISNKEKERILELVEAAMAESFGEQEDGFPACEDRAVRGVKKQAGEGAEEERSLFSPEARKECHTRAFLNIQSGCNQFCTYCIIPYVRGALKSRTEEDVLSEVEELAGNGIIEVVLTGIHLSSYGVDLSEKKSFLELEGKPLLNLIRKIAAVKGIERIRLSSLEPRIITEAFVRDLSEIKELCPHFHLSLQSGCDTVLKRMNRHYTAEEYFEKVQLLRRYFTHPSITTDIIVGFPGESEEEFQETAAFVEKVAFAKVHIFKYSRRKGTMADAMEGQVTEEEKGKRSGILMEKEKDMEIIYRKEFINKEENVLFEEIVLVDGGEYLVGYNERYVRIGVRVQKRMEAEKRINTIGRVFLPGQEVFAGKMLLGQCL